MKRITIFTIFCGMLMLSMASASAQNHTHHQVMKGHYEDMIFSRMSDVAYVDKVRLIGSAKRVLPEERCEFLDSLRNNGIQFYAYVFFPNEVKQNRKYPLMVLNHGGIHGTFGTTFIHFLRELIAQGYIVVAPDYRGSTGYGKGFYEAIDYGGLENEDVRIARDYMVESYEVVDKDRVGIMGWSHGGMITLMNLCQWPERYACGFAGVPVSDVAYRLSYQDPDYKDEFSVKYHIGELPEENPEEYARRSPVSYAKMLERPLMMTTCMNDDDVSWTEVQRMADALEAAGKDFVYKVYPRMDGAHQFDRIDTMEACEIRLLTYQFLAKYLNPPHPFKNIKDLRKAGYKYY